MVICSTENIQSLESTPQELKSLSESNETVDVPLVMSQIFARSALFRLGALMSAGVMDSGYKGVVGALLQVLKSIVAVPQRNAGADSVSSNE